MGRANTHYRPEQRLCSQRQHQGHFGPTVGRRKTEGHGKEELPLTSMTSPEHWAWKNSLPTPPPSHFSLPRNNLEVRQERRLVTSTVWQLVPSVNLAGSRTPAIYASGHAWGWGGLLVGVRRPTRCGWHHFLVRIVNCRKQRKHEHQLAPLSLLPVCRCHVTSCFKLLLSSPPGWTTPLVWEPE